MSVVDVVGESPVEHEPEQTSASMTLPANGSTATAQERDPRVVIVTKRLITTPVLAVSVLAAAVALGLAGMQIMRAMNGEDRIGFVTWIEIGSALFAALGGVVWTWLVVENARRLLAAAVSQNPLSPRTAALSWLLPLTVATAAVGTVAYLERRLNEPGAESTSPIPLAIASATLIVTLFVSYRPMFLLSAMMRRLGSGAGDLARWVWVPISLAVVGGFTLFGLRSGGAYGEEFDGVAPAWAIGVVFVPPVVIVLILAWRGGRLVEDAVSRAYDRRNGVVSTGVGRGGAGMFARALRADAGPPISRDVRSRVTLAPGAGIVRLAMMISVAALTLISVVGALVMFLFWREAADGALLPAQRERAWNALDGLQSFERIVALGATVVAAIWAFVSVLNARIASGRRRNPFLAAAAWPGAAFAIWWIADRFDQTEQVGTLVLRFVLQAVALYIPFFLLERSAIAVGARRSPLRLAYALGVVLLVHIQGLGGLATLVVETDVDRFGRIAGYLALAALLELIATVAITESSRVIGDGASSVADKHNFLADQRAGIEERAAAVQAPGPSIDEGHDEAAGRQRKGAAPVGDLVVGHDAASVDTGIPMPSRSDEAALAAEPAATAAHVAAPVAEVAPPTPDVIAPAVDAGAPADHPHAPAVAAPVPEPRPAPAPLEPAAVSAPVAASVQPVAQAPVQASAPAPVDAAVNEPAASPLTPISLSLDLSAPAVRPSADQTAQPLAATIPPVPTSPASTPSAPVGAPAPQPVAAAAVPPAPVPQPSTSTASTDDNSFSIPKFVHRSVVADEPTPSPSSTDQLTQ